MLDLEKLLVAKAAEADATAGDKPTEDSIAHACVAASKEDKLMCLRGRKYSPERAAGLLPQMLQLKKEYDLEDSSKDANIDRLKKDLSAHAVRTCRYLCHLCSPKNPTSPRYWKKDRCMHAGVLHGWQGLVPPGHCVAEVQIP